MKTLNLTHEDEQNICNQYKQGIPMAQIVNNNNISQSKIYKILKSHNVIFNRRLNITKDQINLAKKLLKDGLSFGNICNQLDVCNASMSIHLRNDGIVIKNSSFFKQKYSLNDNFLEKINSHEKAQFLGLLFADGNASGPPAYSISINLHIQDQEYLEKWRLQIESGKPLYFKPASIRKINGRECEAAPQATLVITNRHFYNNTVNCGILPRKTYLDLKVPKSDILSSKYWNSFILGFFEGDGCISWEKKNKARFNLSFTVGKNFGLDILSILKQELNIDGYYDQNRPIVGRVSIRKIKDIIKLINWMYTDTTITMQRKRDKCLQALEIFQEKGYDTN